MLQLKLTADALAGSYIDAYNDGRILDNPCLCLRWPFATCRNKHVCANGDASSACNDFTMREDEAAEAIE